MTILSRTLSLFASTFILAGLLTPVSHADTLADVYEQAVKDDPTLQAAQATYKANKEIKSQALSRLLPQVRGDYTYTKSDEDSESRRFFSADVPPFDSSFNTEDTTNSYSISLSQDLFNLSTYFSFKQSKALSKQAELQFSIDQQSLILRTAEAYFDVLSAKDNLTSSLAAEKAVSQQLEQTQQRYDVGLIAITDVHSARASHDLSIANRLTAEIDLGIAYEAVAALTGRQPSNLHNLAPNFPVSKPEPANADAWVAYAFGNNLSIKLAEQVAAASNQNANAKKSGHLPTVSGSIRYRDSKTDTSQFSRIDPIGPLPAAFSNANGTTFEIRVDVPIYLGGLKYSEQRQAGFERVRDQANLVAAKRKAVQQARSNYLITVTDTARVTARRRGITSAQSALDATQAGYDAGTRNIVDLLDAQRDLYRAETDYAETRYDYVINSLKLKQAAGTLGPQDIYDLNKWMIPPTAALKSAMVSSSAGR